MAISNAAVTVDTTAGGTAIFAPPAYGPTKYGITVFNNSTTITLYLGKTGVTSANGLVVLPQSSETIDELGRDTLYGIAGSSSVDVRYLTWEKAA